MFNYLSKINLPDAKIKPSFKSNDFVRRPEELPNREKIRCDEKDDSDTSRRYQRIQ